MGETGSLPLEKRGLGAGEARGRRLRNMGGGGKRTRSGRGGNRAPPARMRAPAPPAPRPGLQTTHSAPTARTLEEAEPGGPPRPTGTESRRAPLEVAGCHLFLPGGGPGGLRSRNREHVSLSGSLRSPPPRRRRGRSWACQEESAPGFPAHFNSVSAPTARRCTPGRARALRRTRFTSPTPLPAEGEGGLAPLP